MSFPRGSSGCSNIVPAMLCSNWQWINWILSSDRRDRVPDTVIAPPQSPMFEWKLLRNQK